MNVVDFKRVNDEFGMEDGNEALSYIYRVIQSHLEEEQDEFAARGEMDHFFICMKAKKSDIVKNRLEEIVEDINKFQNEETSFGELDFRIGICMIKEDSRDVSVFLDRARLASQEAAVIHEGRYVIYDRSFDERIRNERELEEIFEYSLKNGDFKVYLQPKIGTKDGKLKSAEALIRWKRPIKGVVPPSEFIPLFERDGKICQLDFYVFEEVCKLLAGWIRDKEQVYPISVNLSRANYRNKNFLQKYYETAKKYEIPDGLIEFELTESIFLEDDQIIQVKQSINDMHQMGFHCALDDFGSGFSSLGLLKEFDVDTLKLDRRFFLNMSGEKAQHVIRSVADLAVKLNLKTVAEGIETEEQLDFLQTIPLDQIQGYIFSPPIPVEEFEKRKSEWE